MSKFKVGDTARITHTDYSSKGYQVGDKRTVVEVDSRGVSLKDDTILPPHPRGMYFYDSELETVNE